MKKIILFLAIFTLVGSASAFEKVGTTSFQFLKVMTDARSTGMAEASSAVVNSFLSSFCMQFRTLSRLMSIFSSIIFVCSAL